MNGRHCADTQHADTLLTDWQGWSVVIAANNVNVDVTSPAADSLHIARLAIRTDQWLASWKLPRTTTVTVAAVRGQRGHDVREQYLILQLIVVVHASWSRRVICRAAVVDWTEMNCRHEQVSRYARSPRHTSFVAAMHQWHSQHPKLRSNAGQAVRKTQVPSMIQEHGSWWGLGRETFESYEQFLFVWQSCLA